jgi:hypothetical protein
VMRDMFELLKKLWPHTWILLSYQASIWWLRFWQQTFRGELHLYDEAFEVQRCEDTPQDKS